MKRILAEEDLPATGEFRPAAILGAISRAKNEMLDETFLAENAVNHRERVIAQLAKRYRERLTAARALDFDDLLLKAVDLFERGARRAGASTRHAGNTSTSTSTRTRTGRSTCGSAPSPPAHRNLCVVGDDDQSIYGWRGANVQNILDFERDYPDATVVKLEQNYRSTQLILDAAHAVVSRNERRTDKKLWTREPGRRPDPALRGVQRGRGGRVDRPPGRGPHRADRARLAGSRGGPTTTSRPGSGPRTSPSCTG